MVAFSEAEKVLNGLNTSVGEIGTAVEENVAAAQKSLESQVAASLIALEKQIAEAHVKMSIGTVPTLYGWNGMSCRPTVSSAASVEAVSRTGQVPQTSVLKMADAEVEFAVMVEG